VRPHGSAAAPSFLTALSLRQPFAIVDLGSAYAKALVLTYGPTAAWSVVGAGSVCYTNRQERLGPEALPQRLHAGLEALDQARRRTPSLCGRVVTPMLVAVTAVQEEVFLACRRSEVSRRRPMRPIEMRDATHAATLADAACMQQARGWPPGEQSGPPLAWLGPIWQASYVDGHGVTGPLGFRGKTLASESTHAFAAGAAIEPLRRWAKAQAAQSVLLPEAAGAAELLRKRSPCLLVDAGGRRTDFYLRAADGALRHTRVPLGGSYFSRWIALAGAISPSRAEGVKLAYGEGRLRPRSVEKMQALTRRALGGYARRVGVAIGALGPGCPTTWLACGGGSLLPEWSCLPAAIVDASMCRFDRRPDLAPLRLSDSSNNVIAGPERLQPCHWLSLGLARYLVRLSLDEAAAQEARRGATLASKAGFEVASEWLSL